MTVMGAILAATLVLVVPAAAYTLMKRTRQRRKLPLSAPPDSSFIWGHEKLSFEQSVGEYYLKWFNEFGPAFKIDTAFHHDELLVLADPAALAHIYVKHNYKYPHSPVYQPVVAEVLGNSLAWAQGQQHVQMKRLLNPSFTHERTRAHWLHAVESVSKFEERLSELVEAQKSSAVINLTEWIWRPMLDIIGRVGFDYDFGCGDSEDGQAIAQAWEHQVNANLTPTGVMGAALFRIFPFIAALPIPAFKELGTTRRRVHRLALEMLSRRRLEAEIEDHTDLLSIFIREQKISPESDDASMAQLLDHVSTFVLAGFETVSTAIGAGLWLLASHPEVQEKLRSEILAFNGIPTYDELTSNNFPYLDAVCKESLRLYQASAHIERVASEDDVLPLKFPVRASDGSYLHSLPIQKGQTILICGTSVDRLECVWGESAAQFRPERWLEEGGLPDTSCMSSGWGGIFAFGQGPRSCIGLRLAVLEWKLVVFALLKKFRLSDTGAKVVHLANAAVVVPQAKVAGEEHKGTQLPVRFDILQ